MSVSLETFLGGGRAFTPMTTNVTVKAGGFRLITLDPDASGREFNLPDARDLVLGGFQHIILNIDATDTVAIKDGAGGAVATLTTDSAIVLGLVANATQAGTWVFDIRSL